MNSYGSLLGLNGHLDRKKTDTIVLGLSTIWRLTMGDEIGEVEDDLTMLRRWFDPVAQGQRLRRELSEIPPVPKHISDPGPPWTFPVSATQSLVTPEGRCVLDLLIGLSNEGYGYILSEAQLVHYDRLLGHLYREWSRHRIRSVVRLLAGEEKPLQLAAAGAVITLLVNRSTSPDRALKRFPDGAGRDVVNEAFFKVVTVFAQTLSPKQRPTQNPRLISGWMLYEARRRLGDNVLIIEAVQSGNETCLWIDESKQHEVLDVVARDLCRGHRIRLTSDSLANAFDALVAAFRAETPRLAGFGIAHERPSNTEQIREELIKKFIYYSEDL